MRPLLIITLVGCVSSSAVERPPELPYSVRHPPSEPTVLEAPTQRQISMLRPSTSFVDPTIGCSTCSSCLFVPTVAVENLTSARIDLCQLYARTAASLSFSIPFGFGLHITLTSNTPRACSLELAVVGRAVVRSVATAPSLTTIQDCVEASLQDALEHHVIPLLRR